MDLEKQGQRGCIGKSLDGRIEPFEVTDLQDATALPSQLIQAFACLGAGGDGLFYQDIKAGFEQGSSEELVGAGGCSNDRAISLLKNVFNGGEVFTANWVSIEDPDQFSMGMEFADGPDVVTPEGARADDGDLQFRQISSRGKYSRGTIRVAMNSTLPVRAGTTVRGRNGRRRESGNGRSRRYWGRGGGR